MRSRVAANSRVAARARVELVVELPDEAVAAPPDEEIVLGDDGFGDV